MAAHASQGKAPCTPAEFEALHLELEETKGMCSAHHTAAKEAVSWAEATSEECNALRQRLKEVESRLALHRNREAAVATQAAQRKQNPGGSRKSGDGSVNEGIEELKEILSEREAEVSSLQGEVSELKMAMARSVEDAERATEDVAVKVASLTHHLEIINSEVAAERQRALDAEARVVAVRKEAAVQAAQANELRGKAMVTEDSLREAEAHAQKLFKDLAASRAEVREKGQELRDANARLDRKGALCLDLEASNKKLTDRLARKTAELAKERSKSASLEATMSTLDSVRNELKIEMHRFKEFQDRKELGGQAESIAKTAAWAQQLQPGALAGGSPPAPHFGALSPDLSAVSASSAAVDDDLLPEDDDGNAAADGQAGAGPCGSSLLDPAGIDIASAVAEKLERERRERQWASAQATPEVSTRSLREDAASRLRESGDFGQRQSWTMQQQPMNPLDVDDIVGKVRRRLLEEPEDAPQEALNAGPPSATALET